MMYQQVCLPEYFDPLTETCSNVVWVEQMGFLPSLSVQDALTIGSAIVGVWALGFSFKLIRKFIFR